MNLLKIKAKYIYCIFLLMMIGVFYLSYKRYEMHLDTMASGQRIKVKAIDVVCRGYKEKHNYFVFKSDKGNRIVNVGKQICNQLNVGDSVIVIYNEDFDLYFPPVINTKDDKVGMVFSIVCILGTVIYLLFIKRKAK